MPISTLPAGANKIWEAAYQSAKGDDCDDGCAARIAWAAVKKKYKKNSEGSWVRKKAVPKIVVRMKGGAGSGHHGHAGRPGKRGGSVPDGAGGSSVTLEEASELWFDYNNAQVISAINRGDENPTANSEYDDYSDEDLDKLQSAAEVLQEVADSNQTDYKRVFRGAVFPDGTDIESIFPNGKTVTLQNLTATHPDREIAKIYTDPQFIGDVSGIGVLLHIENPKGVIGFQSHLGEVILPKGAQYKVTRIFEQDGLQNVSLYVNEALKEFQISKGGAGSGHHGHAGRPGKVGGSSPSGSGSVVSLRESLASGNLSKEDLQEFAKPLVASDDDYDYYTHAVRWTSELDSIESDGIVPGSAGIVYASEAPLVRDRGSGYVVFTLPKGTEVESGKDVVTASEVYTEIRFREVISSEAVTKIVRPIPINAGGHSIYEDEFVKFVLQDPVATFKDPATRYIEVNSPEYMKLFDIVGLSSEKGGAGSGHHGHAGRPGKRGGSLPSGGGGFAPGTVPQSETLQDLRSRRMLGDHLMDGLDKNRIISEYMGEHGGRIPKYDDDELWRVVSDEYRSEIKNDIVDMYEYKEKYHPGDRVSNRSYVFDKQEAWAESSNDSSSRSYIIQDAAVKEFGVPYSTWQEQNMDFMDISVNASPGAMSFVRDMYNITQNKLKSLGYSRDDKITLFRGVKDSNFPEGSIVNYAGNAIESWSVSFDVANTFALKWSNDEQRAIRGNVFAIDVPIGNILCTSRTGLGCMTEGEIVVFGNISGTQVLSVGYGEDQ